MAHGLRKNQLGFGSNPDLVTLGLCLGTGGAGGGRYIASRAHVTLRSTSALPRPGTQSQSMP